MKIMKFVIPVVALLIFILIGLEVILPIYRPEMGILTILIVNGLFLFGTFFYLLDDEDREKPENYKTHNKILVSIYIISFISIMIFIVLYYALDIPRPVFYDLIVLEIALGIIIADSLRIGQ